MATQVSDKTSPTAPVHSSPLNPLAPSSPPRRSLERTLPAPATSLLGEKSGNAADDLPSAASRSRKDGRPQPSLREALGRVRAGTGGSAAGVAAGGMAMSPTTTPLSAGGVGGRALNQQQQQHQAAAERQRQQTALDRTDAVWAEMQQTLRDVELSAGVGTHFFGRGHPTALEELRTAQIALAQAWARGAASQGGNETADIKEVKEKDLREETSSQKSPRASISEADADETEADMAAARRRREASDRYFERVSRHVGEVTKMLENVAVAMGKVEEESREGWSEGDISTASNLDSASQTS